MTARGARGQGERRSADVRRAATWGALLALVATAFLGPTGAASDGPGTAPDGVTATEAAPDGGAGTAADVDASLAAVPGARGATIQRLAGSDRYGSAVQISQHRFADPATASTVYLAHGQEFSDALAAGTLTDGPVLLLRPDCGPVPQVVVDEIDRIDPSRVIALGGTAAVCDSALRTAAGGRATDRIGGLNRFETAVAIARHQFPSGSDRVYLARGTVSPDALVGGMLKDGPILLASFTGRSAPAVTTAAVAELGATEVVALGGTAAVGDAALTAAADGRATSRLSGRDRYLTAIAVAKHAYPSRTANVFLARGDGTNFADAVAAGMLVDGPVLLAPGPCKRTTDSVSSFLTQRHPTRLVGLGGQAALCTSSLRGASLDARPAVDCSVAKCVALTFDDGPSWPTPILLDTLADYRVPVTFFQVGQMVDANGSYSRRAHLEGHEVANHTWDHKQLTLLTRAQQQWEVDVTDNELNQHGVPDTPLLRPPYGSYDSNTRNLGLPLVIWDVDPRDWEGPASTSQVHSRVMSAVRPGSIVLQHDIHINSVNAVPAILRDLLAQDYVPVTVSELVPGLRPGDVVFRRGNVTRAGTAVSPDDTITLMDGTVLGPFLDEAGVPGVAPEVPRSQLLDEGP